MSANYITPKKKLNNEVASVYKEAFIGIFGNEEEIEIIDFQMETIDSFCLSKKIDKIDFLKIDVEGHELSVLKGAITKIKDKAIKVIQFEFNIHNVYSRIFLRDFYLLLEDFMFYRISQKGIISMGAYNTINEIFSFQNIVAIRKDICELLGKEFQIVL